MSAALVTVMLLVTAGAEENLVPSLGVAIGATTGVTASPFIGGDYTHQITEKTAIAAQLRGMVRFTEQGTFFEPTAGFAGGFDAGGLRLIMGELRAGPSWSTHGTLGITTSLSAVFLGGLGFGGWVRFEGPSRVIGFDFTFDVAGLVWSALHFANFFPS